MLIPIQRTTTYPSGVHRFVAYDTSNNTLEALSSSQPIEILKITNERVYTSNITIYGNLEFGEAPSILRQRLQVNPLRKTFYVSNESCNEFFLSTNGIFGGESSNATVFLNQMLLMNYSPEYHDYSVSYTHQIIQPNTEYKITLTVPAAFGDFVDITVFPQLIQESSPQAGNVYQQVQLSYFRPYPDGIAYTDGNVGIGTSNISLAKLTVGGDIFPSSNLTYDLGSSNHNWRDLYLSGNIKFNNTSLKNNIQVTPVRQVFNVQTDTQSLFTVSTEGIYGGEASNVNVFIGQHLLNYYNSNIKDYDLTILRNVDPPITNYTISLTQPAVLGNYVDITVFPQLLPESTPQGFVYQNVVLDAASFTTFAKNGNQIYYNNGNVGIGTSTPTQKLHIEGNIFAKGNVTCSNINVIGDFVTLNTITSNTEQMVIENAGTGPALKVTQTGNNSVAEFYDKESGLAMIVANNGNVGIGTNAPSSSLHVVGTATADALTLGTSTLSTPSGSMPMYACRAWVHFDGTLASGYKAAGNVDTVIRGTTGVYTITFITAMPSTNYACIVTFNGGITSVVTSQPLITKYTSNVIISCFRAETGTSTVRLAVNSTDINVAIFS